MFAGIKMFKTGGKREGVGKGDGVKLGALPAKTHPFAASITSGSPLIGVVLYQISTLEDAEKVQDNLVILIGWPKVWTLNVIALDPLLLVYGGTVDKENVCALSWRRVKR